MILGRAQVNYTQIKYWFAFTVIVMRQCQTALFLGELRSGKLNSARKKVSLLIMNYRKTI